jgi:hypothetical protein
MCRRYCVAHGLTRFGTLTFRDEPSTLTAGWALLEGFRRRLYDHLGQAVPMLVVPEWGSLNGRLHFHLALPVYVEQKKLEAIWGHGIVDIRKIHAPGGAREAARKAAAYLAGYAKKGFTDSERRGPDRRRYSTTKGTAVRRRRAMFPTLAEALDALAHEAPGAVRVWCSDEVEGWPGLPVALFDLAPLESPP